MVNGIFGQSFKVCFGYDNTALTKVIAGIWEHSIIAL